MRYLTYKCQVVLNPRERYTETVPDFQRMPLTTVQPWFETWLKTLHHQEVGTIFFLPHTDLLFRIRQFIQWLEETQQITVHFLDLEITLIDDPENLLAALQKAADRPCLVLARRSFVTPEANRWQAAIESHRTQENKGVLVFHESAPCELAHLRNFHSFSANQTYYPLYTPDQALQFSLRLAKEWQLSLSPVDHLELTTHCGGVLWFVKEALRQIRDGSCHSVSEALVADSLTWKMKQFWEDLPQPYHSALLNTATATPEILSELLRVKLLFTEDHEKYTTWPFLQTYLVDSQQHAFICTDSKVAYFNQDYTHSFSLAERRILALLWQQQEQLVSREALATAFWAETKNEQYSDWALDQIVRRLRLKIKKYSLPLHITTQRGKGYVGSL